MPNFTKLLSIPIVGLYGLSAYAVSEAQKQKVSNNANLSTETVKIKITPTITNLAEKSNKKAFDIKH